MLCRLPVANDRQSAQVLVGAAGASFGASFLGASVGTFSITSTPAQAPPAQPPEHDPQSLTHADEQAGSQQVLAQLVTQGLAQQRAAARRHRRKHPADALDSPPSIEMVNRAMTIPQERPRKRFIRDLPEKTDASCVHVAVIRNKTARDGHRTATT